ncbi:hypothetical protein HDU86_006962 [Geranomyces michiganensis]|nr:hypothetical protein HDU86_006962 [Geranomyces michiganensis]
MDELLKALLTNAALNPNPETLQTALAVADRIRAGNESQERIKALEVASLQEQNLAAALRVKEQELALQISLGRGGGGGGGGGSLVSSPTTTNSSITSTTNRARGGGGGDLAAATTSPTHRVRSNNYHTDNVASTVACTRAQDAGHRGHSPLMFSQQHQLQILQQQQQQQHLHHQQQQQLQQQQELRQQQQQQFVDADPSSTTSAWFDAVTTPVLASRPEDNTAQLLMPPFQQQQQQQPPALLTTNLLPPPPPPPQQQQYSEAPAPPPSLFPSSSQSSMQLGGPSPSPSFLGQPQSISGTWPSSAQQQQNHYPIEDQQRIMDMVNSAPPPPQFYEMNPHHQQHLQQQQPSAVAARSQQPYPPPLPPPPVPRSTNHIEQHRPQSLRHSHHFHHPQTGSRLIGRRGRSTAPIDWNPANHMWTNAHSALFTFGMEDFGHGHSMPQFSSFLDAVERSPIESPGGPSGDPGSSSAASNPTIPVYFEQTNTPYNTHAAAQSRSNPQLVSEDAESRRLSSQFSGSDMPDIDSPASGNIGGGNALPPQSTTPSTTTPTTTTPAARKKKMVVEEDGFCRKCGTQIAIFLLHGEEAALQMQHEIDVLCMPCASQDDPATDPSDTGAPAIATANLVPGSRKRTGPSRRAERAACDVCKRVVAVGSVRLTGDPMHRDRDMEPDFEAEIICVSCRAKYALCTECGGGGRYRTGKWRPLGLFQPGRRTCKLPHVRIGATPVQFAEWLVPDMLDKDLAKRSTILSDIEKAVPSMYYHRLAVPEVMELSPPNDLATFEMLEARVAARCKYLRDFVLDPSIERKYNVRRYFGAAWIDRVSRHKKEKKRPTPTPPHSEQWTEGTAPVDEHGEAKAPGSQSMMVAMISVWWDVRSGCLRLSALQALNTEFTSGSVLFRLTRHVLERIVRDREEFIQQNRGTPPPIEILGLPVFEEFARLPGVQQTLERLAFSHLNDYEKAHPELDRATVERALIDVGGLFGRKPKYSRSFYVGSVSGILAGPWGLQAVAKRRRKGVKAATTIPVSAEA